MTAMAAWSVASSCGEQSSLRHTRRSRRGHLINASPVKESVRQQCHMVKAKALLASRHGVGGGGAHTTSTRKKEEDRERPLRKGVCVCVCVGGWGGGSWERGHIGWRKVWCWRRGKKKSWPGLRRVLAGTLALFALLVSLKPAPKTTSAPPY